MNEKIKELQDIIDHANHIVFFTGAGVSTASGIPDFRSTDGLYNQKYQFPPEEILSHLFFLQQIQGSRGRDYLCRSLSDLEERDAPR